MDVSVVIPTYNRKDSLRETLTSLARQTWPSDRFEVVVVDDGSTDGTEQIAEEAFSFTLRCIRQPNQGSAAARNTGVLNAQGALLIFLDDDMLVETNYVMGLTEEHQRYPHVVGMGTPRPYLPANATPFARLYAHLAASNRVGPEGTFVDFAQCVTNNLSVERDDFFEIGMMQDVGGDGPTWWGDVDFGYRAMQLGFRFRRTGKATCYHRDHGIRNLATASTRAHKAAHMAVALFLKYPEVLPHLPMFHDKTLIAWRRDPPRLITRKLARHVASSRPVLGGMEQIVSILERWYPSLTLLRLLYRWIIGGYIFRGYREGLRQYGPVEVPWPVERKQGSESSEPFTRERTAEGTLEAYEEVLRARSDRGQR